MTNPDSQPDPYQTPAEQYPYSQPEQPYAPQEPQQPYQQAPYQQNGYQQNAYQQAPYQEAQAYYYTPVSPPTDGFSVAALVLGILGFNVFAIVFGIIGLNRTSSGQYSGRGMAIAGIVLGSLTLIALIFVFIFFFALIGAAA